MLEKIPYYNHAIMLSQQREDLAAVLLKVLDRGIPDWGPELPSFEAELAAFCGAADAVGTISGTQALVIALKALGIGPGAQVATVGNTDSCTPSAVRLVGAEPVYIDIEPMTRCMDPVRLAEALAQNPRIRAVLVVDMHGHPADYTAIRPIVAAHGLPLIADACIALGARDQGAQVGTLADITCVSFGSGKLLGTIGTGGACLSSHTGLIRKMRLLSGYGVDRRSLGAQPYEMDGLNVRLPELQAAVLRARLPMLARWIVTRQEQAALYTAALEGSGLGLPQIRPGTSPVWRNYVIGHDRPEALAARLAVLGVETKRLYSPPIYHEPGFLQPAAPAACPVTEAEAGRLLCLPIGPHLTKDQVAQAATRVLRALDA